MSDRKAEKPKSREDRLAEQLRANLKRRKMASRNTKTVSDEKPPKKDTPQP